MSVRGYQAATGKITVDPSDPRYQLIEVKSEGGLSPMGAVRGFSNYERVNVETGELSVDYTLQGEGGDALRLVGVGPSETHADGRITFEGDARVTSGQGRFAKAHGRLRFAGWARPLVDDPTQTVGLFTLEGELEGADVSEPADVPVRDRGESVVQNLDFDFSGRGHVPPLGHFRSTGHNTPGPFNGFVGIVDGRYSVLQSFDLEWRVGNGSRLQSSGLEVIHFELLTLADGTLAPDLTRPSTGDVYFTAQRGTGALEGAKAVFMGSGEFEPDPDDPNRVSVRLAAEGMLSVPAPERCDEEAGQ